MYEHVLTRNENTKQLIMVNDNKFMLGDFIHPTTTTTTTMQQTYYYNARRYSKGDCSFIRNQQIGTINGQQLSNGKYTTLTTIGDFWLIQSSAATGDILYDRMISYSGC